jgi:U3 small nucleolar RNA-associated protein 14
MGRPINKRYLGATADGGDLTGEEKLTAIVKVGSNAVSETGIILRQRTETKFKVDDAANDSGNQGICELVDKDVPSDNEMVLTGYVNGTGDGVNIRKLHNRTMIDFENNRYTWEIQDDSTANVLVLTAI